MKVKEMFEEIKDIFKSEGVEVETTKDKKEKFEDVVMADGTVAQIEPEVIIGAAVVVIQDEELVPAPDGDWELSDGRIITTEDSIIVQIEEIQTEPEEIAEVEDEVRDVEEVDEELDKGLLTEEQQRQAKKIIKSIITEKVFSKEDTNIMNEEFSTRISKLEKSFESLLKLVEYLVSEPTKKKVNKAKNGFSTLYTKKSSVVDKLEKLKNINKLKK
jgi:hypothetical protein